MGRNRKQGYKMKIKITYTNGIKNLGTDYFDIADPTWQDKMQKRGKELGAKFGVGNNGKSIYGIKYDDKHSDKMILRGLECEEKKKIGNVSNNINNEL
jgi:hypothetical protein